MVCNTATVCIQYLFFVDRSCDVSSPCLSIYFRSKPEYSETIEQIFELFHHYSLLISKGLASLYYTTNPKNCDQKVF